MARNSVHIKKSRLQYLLKSKQTNLIKLLKFKNVISSQWFQSLSTAAIAQTPRHHISAAEHQPSNLQKNYLHQKKKKKIICQNSNSFAAVLQPGADTDLSTTSSEDIPLFPASSCCAPALGRFLDGEDSRSGLHAPGQVLLVWMEAKH